MPKDRRPPNFIRGSNSNLGVEFGKKRVLTSADGLKNNLEACRQLQSKAALPPPARDGGHSCGKIRDIPRTRRECRRDAIGLNGDTYVAPSGSGAYSGLLREKKYWRRRLEVREANRTLDPGEWDLAIPAGYRGSHEGLDGTEGFDEDIDARDTKEFSSKFLRSARRDTKGNQFTFPDPPQRPVLHSLSILYDPIDAVEDMVRGNEDLEETEDDSDGRDPDKTRIITLYGLTRRITHHETHQGPSKFSGFEDICGISEDTHSHLPFVFVTLRECQPHPEYTAVLRIFIIRMSERHRSIWVPKAPTI
ncbi:hypothetical protein B0H11DRAFT_2427411 [Mycena galericulata]|nr:hypothetical protein B0H11DRAFT_2427411 [Mycena galericulata]